MKKYPPFALLLLLTVICLVGFGVAVAGPKTCAGCGKAITNGSWVEVEGKAYHSEHFCCAKCDRPIGDAPYWTVDGKYYDSTCYANVIAPRCDYCGKPIVDEWITSDSGTYHPICYNDHVVPRCFVCNKPINGEYFFDEFGQAVCAACKENVLRCSACGKMLARGSAHSHHHDDGRLICDGCLKAAVMDINRARQLMEEVRRDLKAEGIEVEVDVELRLVGQPELARESKGFEEDRLGVTVYEKTGILGGLISFKDFRVCVLYGLPETLLRSVLAHELMHVWMFKNGPGKHDRLLSEGSCEYASFLVLMRNPSDESRFYMDRLKENPDPVYGNGFRKVLAWVGDIGKERWLEHLRENSYAPWAPW